METTLGGKIIAAAILDRDYRCDAECAGIVNECNAFCELVSIHHRKEIENFLLVPSAIDRASARKVADRSKRAGSKTEYSSKVENLLESFASQKKSYVVSQYLADRKRFERIHSPSLHEATINEAALNEFEDRWNDLDSRLQVIPGKEAISAINKRLQEDYQVTVTSTAIIDAMKVDEVPAEMKILVAHISEFASRSIA